MSIFNIFNKDKDKQIIELSSKIEALTERIEKTALNESLAGIIGDRFLTLDTDKYKNAYQNNYVIWRGINLLAQSIAALPIHIYKDQEIVPPERVQSALKGFDINNPNAEMSLYELMYEACIYYFYRGEFIVYIDLEDRMSLEPVNPEKMTRNKNGGWKYNNNKSIPNDQLIYIPLFNPDSNRGLGPVDVIKEELLADDRAREYNIKFFENFGKIGGTLYDDKGQISTTDMQVLVNQFNQAHQSSQKAHKVLGLSGGVKYQELGQTMKEMEFLESRRDIRDKVLAILGIHKSIFGITDQVDRAVADTAMRQLWIHTLQPNAIRIQNKFNQHLFKRYYLGYHCKFDFSEVVELQENQKEKLERAQLLMGLGYTQNEINELLNLGMDEVTDPIGNMRFVPVTLMPVDDLFIGGEETTKIVSNKDDKLDNLAKYLDNEYKVDKASRTYVRKFRILQRASEKKLAGKMGKYFATQLGKVLHVIKDHKDIKDIDEILLLSTVKNLLGKEKEALTTTLIPVFEDISLSANKLAIETIGTVTNPAINDLIVSQMTNHIVDINNYTYKLIKNEVKEAVFNGESIDQLSKRIQGVYKFNSARSRTISRTESAALINRTTNAVYQENNVPKKQWIGGTRPSHAAINGQIKNFDEKFDNGLMFPHDPSGPAGEVVNCSCCLVPIIEK